MTIKRLALLTILLTYLLIVFGGYVASSKSGMGCGPEWPLCNGDVVPTLHRDTLIEFTHRVIGAILGIVSFLLFAKILRTKVSPSVRSVGFWMLVLLIIQVLLGAIVVLKDLPTSVIAGHLIIALLFLTSLIWIWRRTEEEGDIHHRPAGHSEKQKGIKRHFNIALFLLLAVFGLGAYVKHDSLGMICGAFACRDSLLPVTVPEIIQTIHRGLAFVSALYIFFLVYLSFKNGWGDKLQNRLVFSAITVFIQIVLGVLTILKFIDISWAMLHLATGTLLFALIVEARVYLGTAAFLKTKPNIATNQPIANKNRCVKIARVP
ncbi:heme A synthase [Neobacillus sp. NRS-1170]|uniref:COX15/CtaA family protein n=1 Tax=Neobacillus sp. NRS-1170 TaxID=3233898 RepID=UPI003D2A9E54